MRLVTGMGVLALAACAGALTSSHPIVTTSEPIVSTGDYGAPIVRRAAQPRLPLPLVEGADPDPEVDARITVIENELRELTERLKKEHQ